MVLRSFFAVSFRASAVFCAFWIERIGVIKGSMEVCRMFL